MNKDIAAYLLGEVLLTGESMPETATMMEMRDEMTRLQQQAELSAVDPTAPDDDGAVSFLLEARVYETLAALYQLEILARDPEAAAEGPDRIIAEARAALRRA